MLLDDNFEMQGGVRNYLGKTEEVKAPKYWKSSKDSPETELAYITEAEKGLLIDANLHGSLKNGKPNVGASGLLSYDGWGDSDRGTSDASYGGGNVSGDGDNRDYGGNRETQERSNRANQLTQARKAAAVEKARADKARRIAVEKDRQKRVAAAESAARLRAVAEKKRQDDARLNYLTTEYLDLNFKKPDGSIDKEKEIAYRKQFEKYRTGVIQDITPSQKKSNKVVGGLLNTILPGSGMLYNFYLDSTAMGYKMQNPFGNLFGGGGEISLDDVNNLRGGDNGSDSNARSQLVQSITQAINPNLPTSQVNSYFANQNNANLGINTNFLNTYNAAKTKMANTLNMTPPNQQFGYGNTYNDTYARKMNNTNVFYNYLNEQGLI